MSLFNKKLYEYKIRDKVKIDIEKLIRDEDKCIEKICENEEYIFYKYTHTTRYSSTYILGQKRKQPKKALFFGEEYQYICLFNNHLFLADSSVELDWTRDFIKCINIKTGDITKYKWRSKLGNLIFVGGYGRVYNQDTIKAMYVQGENLILDIHRIKAIQSKIVEDDKLFQEELLADANNKEMDYQIIVECINDTFIPHYSYEDHSYTVNRFKLTEEEAQYLRYIVSNSKGIVDENEAKIILDLLKTFSKYGKEKALEEYDLFVHKLIDDGNLGKAIVQSSFFAGILASNGIINDKELEEITTKNQAEIMKSIPKQNYGREV